MAVDDMRDHLILFGYYVDDWSWTFADFANHHYILDDEYISEACSTTSSSVVTTLKFLYPFHIKKKYAVEGIIKGHLSLTCSTVTSVVTAYRVTLCKVHEDTHDEAELFSTNWVTVNDSIAYDAEYNIGNEIVYPFWIDAWEEELLDEHERFYAKVEFDAEATVFMLHYNDSTYEDFKIDIPLRLG